MATYSGIFDNNGYTLYLDVSESNVSTTNNTSVVNWTLRIVSTKSLTYGSWDLYGTSYSVKIDGSTVASGTKTYDFRTYQNLTIASGSKTITHNSDGSKSVSCSATFGNSSTPIGDASASGTFKLTTIARASQPSCITYPNTTENVGSIGSEIIIHMNRKSTSFTHTVKYTFGSLSGTIATGVTDNCLWTIPTTFYSQIPNSNSGTGTINVDTYNGSSLIGTKSVNFVCNVTDSDPTVGTFTYKDDNSTTTAITKDNQRIIRNNSNLLFTVGTASALNSATISKYEITFNGVTKSRTSAGDLDFGKINLSYNSNAILKVTDSRGNTDIKEIEVIIDDWILPTALIDLKRKNNYYSETYLKADATYSSLNGKNTINIQYQCKKVLDTSYSTLEDLEDNEEISIDLDNNFQWDIKVIVKDKIGNTSYNLVLERGMPVIYYDRMLSSVGVNTFPKNENSFEVAGDIILNDKKIDGSGGSGASGDTLPVGSIFEYDGDTVPDGYEEVADENVYSDKETICGTWFGKPLYRKLIKTTNSVINGHTEIPHGIKNIERIFVKEAYFHATGQVLSYQLPIVGYGGEFTSKAYIRIDETNIIFESVGGWGTAWEKVVELNYTKTTD